MNMPIFNKNRGFTMIELLVVIAVIGVLAVAVLSSINPIEQINKGRDTRTRSDAAELISAVDRYLAIQEEYPWNRANTTPAWTAITTATCAGGGNFDFECEFDSTAQATNTWNWSAVLGDTAEVKGPFLTRIENDDEIKIFKDNGPNETVHACFIPRSRQFRLEAVDDCTGLAAGDNHTWNGADGTPNAAVCGTDAIAGTFTETESNYICLPPLQ